MSATRDRRQNRLIPSLIIGGGAFYALQYTGPVLVGVEINGFATLAAAFLFTSVAAVAQDSLWYLGNVFDRKSAKTATGFKGTAGWIKSLDELSHELVLDDWGPYWGAFKGKELIMPIGSNSLVIGTTGSGKGVSVVQVNILTIRGSKVVSDLKAENAAILARALRDRGEKVYCLNIGDVFTDILGPSANYNPLCLIADNFWRPNGLLDVSDDIHEISKQLDPEPVENSGTSDNTYFRNGSRNLIGFAIQMCVLTDGYNATLGDVSAMLNDKQSLIRHAKWACGRLEQIHDQEPA